MATKVTTKKPLTGNRRSHALNATKMTQKPNLQKKTINGEKVIFFQGVTDSSGIIDQILLPAKVPKKVVEQASDVIFTMYTVTAKYPYSNLKRVYEVGIFDNIKVIQPIKFSAMNIMEGGMENE